MHKKQKENQYFFCLRAAHIGVNARTELTHNLNPTAANVHDITETANLLHSEARFVSTDSGYRGAQKREELKYVKADWLIVDIFRKERRAKQES